MRASPPRARGDGGFSLVEVLVAVVILGITGTALIGAVGATARGAVVQHQQANAQSMLAVGAAVIAATPPRACDTPAERDAAVAAYEADVEAGVAGLRLVGQWADVRVEVADLRSWSPSRPLGPCASADAVQLVSLVVSAPDEAPKTLEVTTASKVG